MSILQFAVVPVKDRRGTCAFGEDETGQDDTLMCNI